MIKLELVGNVQYIIMNNGENKQNPEFASEMLNLLNRVIENPDVQSVVLTSSDEKNWSQGIDLFWIRSAFEKKEFSIIKDFLYKMNDVFKMLLTYPIPVIAEITGHAFGNGALLACACDFRFMRGDRGFFCFPEVDVQIPFLPSMIAFAKKAVGFQKFQEMVLLGKRLTGKDAEESNIVLKSFDSLEFLKENVFEFAKNLHKGQNIYKELKIRMYKEVLDSFEEDKEYIDNLLIYYP